MDMQSRNTAKETQAKANSGGDQRAVWPFDPLGITNSFIDYMTDANQRTALYMDILRQRSDDHADMHSRPMATVLSFDHEIILSGETLERPINYSLARVIPPEGTRLDPEKRPVVIADPRSGQGPGISGFSRHGEIGEAFANGHPVYVICFAVDPLPGQTFLDVVEGQVAFFEHVASLHPECPLPFSVGNSQAGYQTLMAAALRPDLFGPVLLSGSPISCWQGERGKHSMRYAGGLTGGTWLTEFTSDLGNGKFDGAHLIGYFNHLDPANAIFRKHHDVYTGVDTAGSPFLNFEKWWGHLITLNGEEIQFLTDNHFVGNKLAANQTETSDGRRFEIRSVRSPIIVFTSLGDEVSPPPQTLGWILDLYRSVDDIRDHGQTIVYCVDPEADHLSIFLSPKVAACEDDVLMRMMDVIDVLPPGLYEIVINRKNQRRAGGDRPSDFRARIEARTLDDIRDFGRNSEEEDQAFATAARWSDITLAGYRSFFQPFVRAMANEHSAETMRATNPFRLEYTLFGGDKPWMRNVPELAEHVRNNRKPVATDNPFFRMQEHAAEAFAATFEGFRRSRNQLAEQIFFSVYSSPALQAFVETMSGPPPQRPPAKTADEEARIAAAREEYQTCIGDGDAFNAKVRALLYALHGISELDERSAYALRRVIIEGADLGADTVKRIVRAQFFALQLDTEKALEALPEMVPDAEGRRSVLADVRAVLKAAGKATPDERERLQRLDKIFKVPRTKNRTKLERSVIEPA